MKGEGDQGKYLKIKELCNQKQFLNDHEIRNFIYGKVLLFQISGKIKYVTYFQPEWDVHQCFI